MGLFSFLGAGPDGRNEALAEKDWSSEALAIIASDIRNLALKLSESKNDLEKAKDSVDEYLASLADLGGEQFFYTALSGLMSPNIRVDKVTRYMLIRYARETRFFALIGNQAKRKEMMRAKTNSGDEKIRGYHNLLASKEVQAYLHWQKNSGTVSNTTRERANAQLREGPASMPNMNTWPAPLDSKPSMDMRNAADRVNQIVRWVSPPRQTAPIVAQVSTEDSILSVDTKRNLDSMPTEKIQKLILKHLTTISHDPQKITTVGTPEQTAYNTLKVLIRYIEVTKKSSIVQKAIEEFGVEEFDTNLFASFTSENIEYRDMLIKIQENSGSGNIEKITGYANSDMLSAFRHSESMRTRA